MNWKITKHETEQVEDTNPDIWLKSAEQSLKEYKANVALYKLDKAINYSNNDAHYILEKVKVLYSIRKYDECMDEIKNNIIMCNKDQRTDMLNKIHEEGQIVQTFQYKN